MYDVAHSKINFKSWPIIVNDKALEPYNKLAGFIFDDVSYVSMQEASRVIIRQLNLDRELFEECLAIVGESRFDYVVKLCKPYKNLSTRERNQLIHDLYDSEEEKIELVEMQNNLKVDDTPVEMFEAKNIDGITIVPETLKWLHDRDITNLALLYEKEDDFFDDHEHFGGVMAFQLFNSAQILLEEKTHRGGCYKA